MSKGKVSAFAVSSLVLMLSASTAFAQDGGFADNLFSTYSMIALSAALAIGIAGAGAAIAQGRAAAAALEGIGRNPNAADKLLTPLLLSLAFMEALGILAFVIAFLLQGNIDASVIIR